MKSHFFYINFKFTRLTSHRDYDMLKPMAKFYKFKKISHSILGVEFTNSAAMALMFMRLQEYTEGRKALRNKILSEGDTLITYLEKRKKVYYKDGWLGFNLRGDIILAILKNDNGIIWNKYESKLIARIHHEWAMKIDKFHSGQFFVLAWMKKDKKTKAHEMCHAEFYLNRSYRYKVEWILENANIKRARKCLEKEGYNFKDPTNGMYILYDEINSYAMTDPKKEVKKLHLSKSILKQLRKVYREFL
jgi:hypothetical protein